MIDLKDISYEFVLLNSQGRKYMMAELQQALSWEENPGELAVRMQATLHNIAVEGTYITQLAALGSKVFITSNWGTGTEEIFQGTIFNWDYRSSAKKDLNITAYDNLIYLRKSDDNRYYSAGTSSKSIILDIFEDWGVPVAKYEGPDIAMAKKVFKSQTLAAMVLEVLDDAKKKGAGKFIVRSSNGKVEIIPRGSNRLVYHFAADNNTIVTSDRQDIEDLVTRVKIVGAEDSEGRSPVEAIVDGRTEFGVLQRIFHREQDDTLASAKSSAKDILDEQGKPRRATSIQAPDLPFLRKGDKIYVNAGNLYGYYYITGIQHDATARTMTMEVEP